MPFSSPLRGNRKECTKCFTHRSSCIFVVRCFVRESCVYAAGVHRGEEPRTVFFAHFAQRQTEKIAAQSHARHRGLDRNGIDLTEERPDEREQGEAVRVLPPKCGSARHSSTSLCISRGTMFAATEITPAPPSAQTTAVSLVAADQTEKPSPQRLRVSWIRGEAAGGLLDADDVRVLREHSVGLGGAAHAGAGWDVRR